ncbi:MAG: hypothetical protein FWB84_08550 [Candidatus Bathyarchaeota archaeon]|uniref:hypothetical protein n=1 Tax=Candidatus Bathycorpusculum sp. TaxID=2994959 RepID=UPI0028235537|nr:hypothetical protein [Candidatus Termiticorpusculum sp.]MCL2291460.1 hypothetical protein [Candidatus Termiticorpusculum sp.]
MRSNRLIQQWKNPLASIRWVSSSFSAVVDLLQELLGLDVNKSWMQAGEQVKVKAKVAVSDNEVSLREVLLEKVGEY